MLTNTTSSRRIRLKEGSFEHVSHVGIEGALFTKQALQVISPNDTSCLLRMGALHQNEFNKEKKRAKDECEKYQILYSDRTDVANDMKELIQEKENSLILSEKQSAETTLKNEKLIQEKEDMILRQKQSAETILAMRFKSKLLVKKAQDATFQRDQMLQALCNIQQFSESVSKQRQVEQTQAPQMNLVLQEMDSVLRDRIRRNSRSANLNEMYSLN
jgi:hypothetical protein